MRVSAVLLRKTGRTPQKEPVPFQEILPLKLKDKVSGKGDKTSEVCCIQEMMILFSCLKTNEFNQSLCSKEISKFQQCYTDTTTKKHLKKENDLKGVMAPGQKNLSYKHINYLLSRYPNVK